MLEQHTSQAAPMTSDVGDFIKHDAGKPALELLPPLALIEVGKILAYGAQKYAAHNWRKVNDRARYTGATLRHLFAYMAGEDNDPESGQPHLAHVATNALFMLECDLANLGKDTRPQEKN